MATDSTTHRVSLAIAILTISDTRDERSDSSGTLLAERALQDGHQLVQRAIIRDDKYQIRARISQWIAAADVQVIITSGGTGVTGRDITPEAVTPLFDRELAGFGETFRLLSYQQIGPSTILSRAVAGIANGTLIFCLPGSNHACALAWDQIIGKLLDSDNKPCNFAKLMSRLAE
ncbi:MAG: molybdenum cofactor biosynthesis protein B [Gammaproteobacteria bacterium]|nr:molybdenum cofactor biosynthesis protein B [Gammaproteobacteria bacterium]